MLSVFGGIKHLVKFSHVKNDNVVFRLHYHFTVAFLLASSAIITARQYVGNPIDCTHGKDIPEDVLNTYCWIHSTWTVPSAFWKRIGIDVAHPGMLTSTDPHERKYVKYYQWVCFILVFQVSRKCDPRTLHDPIVGHAHIKNDSCSMQVANAG